MFTIAAMFCGFYAMVQSINGYFLHAGMGIFYAMILDSLDGRVARLTHSSSPFGAELDTLADMLSFGVAPALIIFNWQLNHFGKIGWLSAFIYCACAALRLARFNTLIATGDKKFFIGLPSTAAAPLVVGYVYVCISYNLNNLFFNYFSLGVTIFAAFSMVCNIKFYSFKEFNFHHKAPFRALLIFILVLALLFIYPDIVIYAFFVLYPVVSYIIYLFKISYYKKIMV